MDLTMMWIVALVILVAIEAFTLGLTSIWFAIGALLALVADLLGASVFIQVIVFLVGSTASLFAVRPLAVDLLKIGKERTNADQVIGKNAIVTQDIDNDIGQGLVKIGGQTWSARSETEMRIAAGTEVVVLRISGVKVYVKPI